MCLLTALSVWEFCALAAQKQFALEPQLSKLAISDLRFLTPFFLLPRTSSHHQLQPRRREAATPAPQAAGICGPALPSPYAFSMAAHYTRRGTPHLAPALLTCREPASSVSVCPHLCGCIGLHLHCSSLLPLGPPPRHAAAYATHQGTLVHQVPGPVLGPVSSFCQRGPCSVPTPVCHPVLHWVFPGSAIYTGYPLSPPSQPVFLLVVGEHKGGGVKFLMGCHRPLPYPLKLRSQQLAPQGPTEAEGFSLGTLSQY